jgi:type II secretory pathway pseudopilin PulG
VRRPTPGDETTPGRLARTGRNDAGISLVEVLVTMVITLIVVALLPPILETVSGSTSTSEAISSATAHARLATDNLVSQVGSAVQICLPTTLTSTGPTVAAGFAVRVESLAFGTTEWDQWMLNTTTHQLEEQRWLATWTTASPVPSWVVIAEPVVNTTVVPFSLPTTATGSPQILGVVLSMTGGQKHTLQTVLVQTTIAALDTPYAPGQPTQPCATTED